MLKDRIVAHRGYQRKYPENTLLAMGEAIEAGASFLETDIQLTRDLKPVLYHDSLLARVSGREGYIHDLDCVEANTLPAYEPLRLKDKFSSESIATLEMFAGFLKNHKKVTVFVEIKEESITTFGRQVVCEAITGPLSKVHDQVVMISFDVDIIAMLKNCGWKTGVVLREWCQMDSPQVSAIQPDYLFINVKRIPACEDLANVTPLLVVYEIDQPEIAIELFERGADMIETFDIGGMLASLSSHSL